MPLTITEMTVRDRFHLQLRFSDGANGLVDVEPFLWGEMFLPLRDLDRFQEAFLDPALGTVAWPNGADLAPAALRERLVSAA